MSNAIVIHKGRTVSVAVNLGMDVSTDTFTSEIRTQPKLDSYKIATWTVAFATDGTDGKLILTLDDETTSEIAYTNGYMDLKRVTSGEPISVFDEPIPVVFKGSVTE